VPNGFVPSVPGQTDSPKSAVVERRKPTHAPGKRKALIGGLATTAIARRKVSPIPTGHAAAGPKGNAPHLLIHRVLGG
jgi:hypothetical protein